MSTKCWNCDTQIKTSASTCPDCKDPYCPECDACGCGKEEFEDEEDLDDEEAELKQLAKDIEDLDRQELAAAKAKEEEARTPVRRIITQNEVVITKIPEGVKGSKDKFNPPATPAKIAPPVIEQPIYKAETYSPQYKAETYSPQYKAETISTVSASTIPMQALIPEKEEDTTPCEVGIVEDTFEMVQRHQLEETTISTVIDGYYATITFAKF